MSLHCRLQGGPVRGRGCMSLNCSVNEYQTSSFCNFREIHVLLLKFYTQLCPKFAILRNILIIFVIIHFNDAAVLFCMV